MSALIAEMGTEGALELLEAISAGAPAAVSTLREAFDSGDRARLKRQVHTLKSNCAMVGARDLSDVCQQLEQLALHGELDALRPLFVRIESGYGELGQALQTAANSLPTA